MTQQCGFQTEIDFELPKGFIDEAGMLHRRGRMRLATAGDEILPLRDPRVQQNEAYLTIIVLSRVITRLGSISEIHTGTIERLFAADLAYLQRLYEDFNSVSLDETSNLKGRSSETDGPTIRRFAAVGEV